MTLMKTRAKETENQSMSETDLDVNEFRMEDVFDAESDQQSSEILCKNLTIQKVIMNIVFTKDFDEIEKLKI